MEETIFTLEEIEHALLSCPKFKVTPKENSVISSMSFEDIETIEIKMFLFKLISKKYGVNALNDKNIILALSIRELNLTPRIRNVLDYANIETIGQLISLSRMDLFRFRNFGKRSVEYLENQLHKKYNLKLAPNEL